MRQNNKKNGLNRTTAEVYHALRKKILEGAYPPDYRFNQNELAEEMKVSRTPVVKALHMLTNDGLVDNIMQRGFYLHSVTLGEMIDLYMLRQSMEMIAAYQAAENATAEELDLLESFFDKFIGIHEPIDHQAYYEADRKFHDYLFSLCKNRWVRKIEETMQIMRKTYTGGLLRKPEETLEEHRGIIAAIKKRDAQTAQILMMQHLEYSRKQMQSTVQRLSSMGIEASMLPVGKFSLKGNDF